MLLSIWRKHAVARLAGDALPGLSKRKTARSSEWRGSSPAASGSAGTARLFLATAAMLAEHVRREEDEGPQEFKTVESRQPLLVIVGGRDDFTDLL